MTMEEGSLVNHVAPAGMSNNFWQRATFVIMGLLAGCMCKNKDWYNPQNYCVSRKPWVGCSLTPVSKVPSLRD
jgi:hypothetical protein